jgi:hypothetical protein
MVTRQRKLGLSCLSTLSAGGCRMEGGGSNNPLVEETDNIQEEISQDFWFLPKRMDRIEGT